MPWRAAPARPPRRPRRRCPPRACCGWERAGGAHGRMRMSPPSWSTMISGGPCAPCFSAPASALAWSGPVRLSRNRIAPAARPSRQHPRARSRARCAGEAQHDEAPDLLASAAAPRRPSSPRPRGRAAWPPAPARRCGPAAAAADRDADDERQRGRHAERRQTPPRDGAPPLGRLRLLVFRDASMRKEVIGAGRGNVSARTTGGRGSHEGLGPHHRAAEGRRRQDRAPGRAGPRARLHVRRGAQARRGAEPALHLPRPARADVPRLLRAGPPGRRPPPGA